MTITEDTIKDQIPHYLTQPQKVALAAALNDFINGGSLKSFEIDAYAGDLLQGDGWTGLTLFSFSSGERRSVRGLILSNSCDIDPANPRDMPAKVTFVPLIRLSKLENVWLEAGVENNRIEQKIRAVRSQNITSMFYLPKLHQLEESVAMLEDAHSMPLDTFLSTASANNGRKKLFTLSQSAFYLLMFKLSVHFCRMHENVNRE
jgi:hypothetical protein